MSDPEKYSEKSPVERYDEQFSGKSPVERTDYEGLQLDVREKRGFDHYRVLSGSQKKELEGLQASPTSTMGTPFQDRKPAYIDDIVAQPKPEEHRICGVRRKSFWIFFWIILGIIIIAAIIGGAVGGTRHRGSNPTPSSPPPPPPPSPSPPPPPAPLAPYDMMAASPIKAIAFESNNSQNGSLQSIRLHYQSVNGNIKELSYDGSFAGWQNAKPIFTDARNHSGLASFAYLNGTNLTGTLIYQASNGYLQEKRKNLASKDVWLPGTLNRKNFQVNSSVTSQPDTSDDNPNNDWDGSNIAAVYSNNFPAGPGARLYYHFGKLNGSQWIQEIIWDQNTDTWEAGAALEGASPNSHIAATIDDHNKAVRVFYCSGNRTLQESWLNMSQPNGKYEAGIKLPDFLSKNDADFTALTVNSSTLIYYYSSAPPSAGIHEFNLTGPPSNKGPTNPPRNTSIVANPALLSKDNAQSLYTPMAATLGQASGVTPMIYVFYADNTNSPTSGYSRLSELGRPVDGQWPVPAYGSSEGQVQLPLGTESAAPS